MTTRAVVAAFLTALLGAGCDGGRSGSNVPSPGEPESGRTRVLEAGAAVLQDRAPLDALNAYLDGFHFYSGNPRGQMEAHHYCAVLDEDLIQCAIFDGSGRDAKLMGVEYIVSAKLFATLPAAEKSLWHSHVHEVKSGQLVAPGLPAVAENALMRKIVGTYGKTWHTWHTDRQKTLPIGVPQLMMGFTADGQVDAAMVTARDKRLGIDSGERRAKRGDIPAPPIDPAADAWQRGPAIQLADPTGSERDAPHGAQHPAAAAVPSPPASR